MQNTTNYNLKKPDYTDFADIADINDNMDTIDAQLAAPTGDSADSTTTFTTSDTADGSASSWTTVPALTSGETHKSLFAKMSQMFKNIRYLYKMLGTTDISSIGNGTVTNALSVLNAKRDWRDEIYTDVTGQVNISTPDAADIPLEWKEIYITVKGRAGMYYILIPKKVFNTVGTGTSFYLNGWYYSTSSNSYGFVTKTSARIIRMTALFENGVDITTQAVSHAYFR